MGRVAICSEPVPDHRPLFIGEEFGRVRIVVDKPISRHSDYNCGDTLLHQVSRNIQSLYLG